MTSCVYLPLDFYIPSLFLRIADLCPVVFMFRLMILLALFLGLKKIIETTITYSMMWCNALVERFVSQDCKREIKKRNINFLRSAWGRKIKVKLGKIV